MRWKFAIHWRFEETECRGHHVGLCFVRCDDGSVINSGLRPEVQAWSNVCPYADGHFPGVLLGKDDILDVIQERALNHSVTTMYFATDGRLHRPESITLVKRSVEALRKRGLTVVGLWNVPGLLNLADGKHFDLATIFGKNNKVTCNSVFSRSLISTAIASFGFNLGFRVFLALSKPQLRCCVLAESQFDSLLLVSVHQK